MGSTITCGSSLSKEMAFISLWVEGTTQGGWIFKGRSDKVASVGLSQDPASALARCVSWGGDWQGAGTLQRFWFIYLNHSGASTLSVFTSNPAMTRNHAPSMLASVGRAQVITRKFSQIPLPHLIFSGFLIWKYVLLFVCCEYFGSPLNFNLCEGISFER